MSGPAGEKLFLTIGPLRMESKCHTCIAKMDEVVKIIWLTNGCSFAVLHGVSATMQPGQTIALCGRTGR